MGLVCFCAERVNIAHLRLMFLERPAFEGGSQELEFPRGFHFFRIDKSNLLCLDCLCNSIVSAEHFPSFWTFDKCQIEAAYMNSLQWKPRALHLSWAGERDHTCCCLLVAGGSVQCSSSWDAECLRKLARGLLQTAVCFTLLICVPLLCHCKKSQPWV